ncbi:Tat (twin-arginine translocation) pathway signal sequence [Mucilaginibacter pineti]|uniref:Tat (Twin-arginine translocation) pathway signal sequence n=1 Tax=Mucilaginibacter pineti TaxID=1391627 RepID=A0A1G7FWD4_9SPHI|nr:SGNH/GDSL hydrolase family protein [Mucilaginibacter pineti]SDE80092.1 Tat (twin-arginine translocation) pathway signal sequence [Mucilaginibacter pineti]
MKKPEESSRRNFIKQASVIGAGAFALPAALSSFTLPVDAKAGENYTFLFQGDSITDGNRTRDLDWNHVLGHGYAYMIAARLWFQLPEKKFHFFNRGISGHTVNDLTARWDKDTIALKPDLLSILIGINDANHAVEGDKSYTIESYTEGYRALLTKTRQQLPQTQLVILEPFILPVGRVKDKWEDFQREVTGRQAAAKKLAAEFDAIFVPLQECFTKAAGKYPPDDYWLWDGIHPMPNGHELMTREWIKHVSKKLKFIG